MDNQDRQNTLTKLETTSEWTIWKTRDKEWSPVLQKPGFHHLLNIHKDKEEEYWGFKVKGWCRIGDIRTTKTRKSFECWVKTTSDVPTGDQKLFTETLTAPQYNVGKDVYTVDLESDVLNQDFWGSSVLKGHARWGMAPVILQRNQWEWSSVTSVTCNGTPLHHYHMCSSKNSGFENPAKWAEKRKVSARIDRN